MEAVKIRVIRLRPSARLPDRATENATGFDLHACLDTEIVLGPAPRFVYCGIAVEAPAGWDMQVRPRSGLSTRGVGVAFGTIDPDYRGELVVTMWTFGICDRYVVRDGDRIAQLVVARAAFAEFVEVSELSTTGRADRGHGSTGR